MPKKHHSKNKLKTATTAAEEPNVAPTQTGGFHSTRETIESIVIAFVLAFLFRTFQAEAFVIPTGSMSPSLQGQHKDVCCSECGYRFRTTASTEGEDKAALMARANNRRLGIQERERARILAESQDVLAGICPMCRQTVAFRDDLGDRVPEFIKIENTQESPSYPGDRVLVNKYGFAFEEPDRWDVVVFKFPGDGSMNYIKRLVGMPGETLRIYQGDVFVRADGDAEFRILRRPEGTLRAMLQPVHDTDYESSTLYEAGWPLRWSPEEGSAWQTEAEASGGAVDLAYSVDAPSGATQWLAYSHLPASQDVWARVFTGNHDRLAELAVPELITDFNPYNARILRGQVLGQTRRRAPPSWRIEPGRLGSQWVGDLALRCEVEFTESEGEFVLDLVEAGKHFSCTIDVPTGRATMGIEGLEGYAPTAEIAGWRGGSAELLFANVDDRLWLWVDGKAVEFAGADYDAEELFGDRKNAVPRTDDSDAGDLHPARVGARGLSCGVTRLEVLRDIYYLAVDQDDRQISAEWVDGGYFSDYGSPHASHQLSGGVRLLGLTDAHDLFADPNQWPRFRLRQKKDFDVGEDQFFVLGDNSPESSDCRLWMQNKIGNGHLRGVPGGPYLERSLLTGKALCVFWPHSWGGVPGIEKLPGLPNFGDMRIVR